MAESRISVWNEAGKAGLVLGGISILYLVISMFAQKLGGTGVAAVLIGIMAFLLWAAKTFACIYLMRWCMLRFSNRNPDAGTRMVFLYGTAAALYSALLYSGFYLAYVLYINPEALTASFELIMQQYSGILDAQTLESIQNLQSDMPAISFFANLFWCWLFGTVLSGIFTRSIAGPSNNPFKDQQ